MSKNQNNKPDSFAVFALICMGITLVVSLAHEMYIWLK